MPEDLESIYEAGKQSPVINGADQDGEGYIQQQAQQQPPLPQEEEGNEGGDPQKEGGDPENKEEEVEGQEPKTENGEGEEPDPFDSIYDSVKEKYFKESDFIESKEDLQEFLASAEESLRLYEENEALQQRLKEIEGQGPAEIKFEDEKQKAAYEFVLNAKTPEAGAQEYYRIMAMDLDNMSPKEVLAEAFLQENKDVGIEREKLLRAFEEEFKSKYDFDEYEDDEEKLDTLRTKLAIEAERAKSELRKTKESMQIEPKAQPEQKSPEQEIELESLESYASYQSVHSSLTEDKIVQYPSLTDDPKDVFNVELSDEHVSDIEANMEAYLKSAAQQGYDLKQADVEKVYEKFVNMAVGQLAVENAIKHGINLGRKQELMKLEGKAPGQNQGNAGQGRQSIEDLWKNAKSQSFQV